MLWVDRLKYSSPFGSLHMTITVYATYLTI
jgi:hypothetical protein